MRLLLDTTYFLPVIGISIKGIPRDAPVRLMQAGNKVSLSNISLFELSAKGAKLILAGKLTEERVATGIRALLHEESVETIESYETTILLTAFRLRSSLDDFIDCLILSSALNNAEVLVTEDTRIQGLRRDRGFNELVRISNPSFRIAKLTEML